MSDKQRYQRRFCGNMYAPVQESNANAARMIDAETWGLPASRCNGILIPAQFLPSRLADVRTRLLLWRCHSI